MYFLFIFVLFIEHSSSNPAIVWNIKSKDLSLPLDKLISAATETKPVILFLFKDFDLAQFSKHASVYGGNEGGSLKELKAVIDFSEGYSVKAYELSNEILSSLSVTVYNATSDENLSKSSVIVVHIHSWKDLDNIPATVIQRVDRPNYVAILTKPPQKTSRSKREVKISERQKRRNENMTLIYNLNCLFYAQRVIFHVANYTTPQQPSIYHYVMPSFISVSGNETTTGTNQSTCSNYSNSYILDYELNDNISKSGPFGLTLHKLQLVMNMKLNKGMGWWSVDTMEVTGEGTVFEPGGSYSKELNGTDLAGFIAGPSGFCYACGKQKQVTLPSKEKANPEGDTQEPTKPKIRYGISFERVQVQPFALKLHNKKGFPFTDDVYDCVPFISIATWMFIVCVTILLAVIFFGICMMSKLQTNDRFDDPKGKPLAINVIE